MTPSTAALVCLSYSTTQRRCRRKHRHTETDTYHHTRTFAEKIRRTDYEALIKQRHWHDTSITECCTHSTKHPQRHTHPYRKQLRHSQIKDCHSTRLVTSSGKTQVYQHCTYSAGRHFFGRSVTAQLRWSCRYVERQKSEGS